MWLLIVFTGLIIFFIFFLTQKRSLKTSKSIFRQQIDPDLPWGAQKYGVSAEVAVPFQGSSRKNEIFNEMLTRMGWEPFEEELTNATLFGLAIALQSDDYARAGIEFEDPAFVAAQLKKVEFELFDSELYSQYNFYSHSIISLQDMLAQSRSKVDKETMRTALDNYSAQIKSIEPHLKRIFQGLYRHELGTRHDRQLFYFKMGVTNFLRSQRIVAQLDQLYRVQGVNYPVEQAFQLVNQDFPFFQKLLNQGIENLGKATVLEIQSFIKGELRAARSAQAPSTTQLPNQDMPEP